MLFKKQAMLVIASLQLLLMRVERNGHERLGIFKQLLDNLGHPRRIIDPEKLHMKLIVQSGPDHQIRFGSHLFIDGFTFLKDFRRNSREITL